MNKPRLLQQSGENIYEGLSAADRRKELFGTIKNGAIIGGAPQSLDYFMLVANKDAEISAETIAAAWAELEKSEGEAVSKGYVEDENGQPKKVFEQVIKSVNIYFDNVDLPIREYHTWVGATFANTARIEEYDENYENVYFFDATGQSLKITGGLPAIEAMAEVHKLKRKRLMELNFRIVDFPINGHFRIFFKNVYQINAFKQAFEKAFKMVNGDADLVGKVIFELTTRKWVNKEMNDAVTHYLDVKLPETPQICQLPQSERVSAMLNALEGLKKDNDAKKALIAAKELSESNDDDELGF